MSSGEKRMYSLVKKWGICWGSDWNVWYGREYDGVMISRESMRRLWGDVERCGGYKVEKVVKMGRGVNGGGWRGVKGGEKDGEWKVEKIGSWEW